MCLSSFASINLFLFMLPWSTIHFDFYFFLLRGYGHCVVKLLIMELQTLFKNLVESDL
jgi:hypothetical protein